MTPTTRTSKTTIRTTEAETSTAAASRYQQLRSHLAELKLTAAAEARDLTPCVGHAQSQECAGGSEMIQPDGKEKLPR